MPDENARLASVPNRIIVGTAGHIDHGKTSLVRAVTGVDTDRLKEEKLRGITIELGFADWQPSPELPPVSFVDMPGHERFVRQMIAGASGVDLVLLVVAADEGVMPQTREHLDICRLLGIERGIAILSKIDLGEEDWRALVREDLELYVESVFGRRWPVLEFSTRFSDGELAHFRHDLAQQVAGMIGQTRPASGLFRLPIDRAFTMHGFGTVVTGSVTSGRLQTGDAVCVQPARATSKARRIQIHGRDAEHASAGMRAAINLPGIEVDAIERGSVVVAPDVVEPSLVFDAHLDVLAIPQRRLKKRTALLCHAGTAQRLAQVRLYGEALEPGESGYARIVLDKPVFLLPDDRFVLRDFTNHRDHGRTIAGGRVLAIDEARLRPNSAAIESLGRLALADDGERLAESVRRSQTAGLRAEALRYLYSFSPERCAAAIEGLLAAGVLIAGDTGNNTTYFHSSVIESLENAVLRQVDTHHEQQPEQLGLPKETLRTRLRGVSGSLMELILARLAERGAIRRDEQTVAGARFAAEAEKRRRSGLYKQLAELLERAGPTPPKLEELVAACGQSRAKVDGMLRLLVQDRVITRVSDELHFHNGYLSDLEARLRRHLEQRREITASELKELTGSSRKYTIPLGEYFDNQRITIRVGDVRRLRGEG